MIKLIKRVWKYVSTLGRVKFDAAADPTVQLEQAIEEAEDQHSRLVDQAANVIASAKQTQMNLDRAHVELDQTQANARQALLLQADAQKKNDAAGAEKFGSTARTFATRLVGLQGRVSDLEAQLLTASAGADNAKKMVRNNALQFQKKLAEKNELLSTLERAKVNERYNDAQKALTATVGEDVPSFDEIRNKINARAARAEGMGELMGTSVESGVLEVEAAAMDAQADSVLKVMAIQLGLEAAPEPEALNAADEGIVDATIVPDSPAGVQTPVAGRESRDQ